MLLSHLLQKTLTLFGVFYKLTNTFIPPKAGCKKLLEWLFYQRRARAWEMRKIPEYSLKSIGNK